LLRWQHYFQCLLENELQTQEKNEKVNENIEELEDTDKPTLRKRFRSSGK
jgi:hypothetical protein